MKNETNEKLDTIIELLREMNRVDKVKILHNPFKLGDSNGGYVVNSTTNSLTQPTTHYYGGDTWKPIQDKLNSTVWKNDSGSQMEIFDNGDMVMYTG